MQIIKSWKRQTIRKSRVQSYGSGILALREPTESRRSYSRPAQTAFFTWV